MRSETNYYLAQHPMISVQPLHGANPHNPDSRPDLPEAVVSMAEAEYERRGFGQTADRLRERGGLSALEVVCLLGDALARYAPPAELVPESRRRGR